MWDHEALYEMRNVLCRVIVLYLVPTIYRFKYYFAWAVAEAGLTLSGFNYNGVDDKGVFAWDRYVNTRIAHVEFQTSLAKLPEHWNICTGLFLRQCKSIRPVQTSSRFAVMVVNTVYRCCTCQNSRICFVYLAKCFQQLRLLLEMPGNGHD